jgi:arylsulfatase A-like enzyme
MMKRYAVLIVGTLSACTGRPDPAPVTIRLADIYKPEMVEGAAVAIPASAIPRTEIRFDKPAPAPVPLPPSAPKAEKLAAEKLAATRGWEGSKGIAGLAVRDGLLTGQLTDDVAIIHLERKAGLDDRDQIDALEIRARVSAGTEMAVRFMSQEKVDLEKSVTRIRETGTREKVTLTPGPDLKTYTFAARMFTRPPVASEIRHILIRPTNVKGARFEIESVRLVMRREKLAQIASGLSWQGLSEVYRETLVARSPEVIKVKVRLPARPMLDLGLGTIEDGPVTFRVGVTRGTGTEMAVLERTLTTSQRWEDAPVDLSAYAGQDVTLSLALVSDRKGALGFWGAPAIRSLGAMPRAAQAGPTPQGVIVIWSDTTRADHLSVYGYERDTTPVLRRMAAEGALFKDCVGQATWTKVATPTLMTSLYPLSHGVHDFSDRIPSSATTMAEVFQQAGYATLSMSSILFTGRFTNLHQGFEQLHEDGSLPDKESSKTARIYVDRLLPWLSAHREVPFFVFLHVSDPHDPFRPEPPYDSMWADPAKREEHEANQKKARAAIAHPLLKAFGMPNRAEMVKAGIDPDAYIAQDVGWYDGSIRGMDVEIGRLVEGLKGLGLADKTLVVYTADHGEEFLEHGRTFHGQTTYGELNHVPLLFWGAVPKGVVVSETVETIDVMPTVLEIARVSPPAGMQGHSLVPLLGPPGASRGAVQAASGWTPRPALTEKAVTHEPMGAPPPQDTESYAVVAGDYKLIVNSKRPAGSTSPEFELYDHRTDPLDKTDIASAHPGVVARLAKEITAWRTRAETERLKPDAAATDSMTPEQLERLKALGYVQ